MSKINSFLQDRLKKPSDKLSKMSDLAERSSQGHLSSFAGVFKVGTLSPEELDSLKLLLESHQETEQDIRADLLILSSITSEVRAINNQAVLLHGERIKRAQEILKKYKEGAFTIWLIQTYGNRQTPYNFLQYFELHRKLSPPLLPKLDEIPRQAAYTLASREGPLEKKEEIIRAYQGETKQLLLEKIRIAFPLSAKDKRASSAASYLVKALQKISDFLSQNPIHLNNPQRKKVEELLTSLQKNLNL
jgi:hypothetical protein